MKSEIQKLHKELIGILDSKKINYSNLRSALVPSTDKNEIVLVFDSSATGSHMYGAQVFEQLLPLLDPRTTQSILVGDFLGRNQRLIFEIIDESMVLARSFKIKHASLIYGVYINNVSDASLNDLHRGLSGYAAYLGYIPTTFLNRAKVYMSTCMAGFLVKYGKTLIMAHEDDQPNSEDINLTAYDLEAFDYKVASIQSLYFSVFLNYKIERPIFKGDEADVELALNSISNNVQPLGEFVVQLDEPKHYYLLDKKLGSLQKAGLAEASRSEIEDQIRAKVTQSHIYNLDYLPEHNVMKFNVVIELDRHGGYPARLMASLEYIPDKKILRVITLF